jgi:threonine dehydratase
MEAREILEAASRLGRSGLIYQTPLARCEPLSARLGLELYQKLELFQNTGSFKLRGATNKLLTLTGEERARGIITASAGNHALGVAHASRHLGIKATIVVPKEASAAKVEALRRYPVTLILEGDNYDAAELYARQLEKERGLVFVSAYNDPQVIAGQGTLALEVLQALPDAAVLLVPVGGGGLVSGIGLWAKTVAPNIKLIGVQSEASPAMHAALAAGKIVPAPDLPSLADGLAGNLEAGTITFEIAQRHVDEMVLVREEDIAGAIRFFADELHFIAEGSSAVGTAALLSGRVNLKGINGPVVDFVCGRNIAPATLRKILINN